MTDEDAFQAALDKNPEDHITRAVFADWLDDRGDPRGPGYRELAAQGRVVGECRATWGRYIWGDVDRLGADNHHFRARPFCGIPQNWFYALKGDAADQRGFWAYYSTRRAAENAAALAWAALCSSAGK